MTQSYQIIELNPEQREAVEHLGGPLLILAGAGSGKTRVLAARAAHLVHSGVSHPWQILALTFTNKAADELRSRCVSMIGVRGESIIAGTFHSIFARFIRREGLNIDIDPHFTIIDKDDSLKLVKAILKENKIAIGTTRPAEIVWAISRAKNALVDPDEFSGKARSMTDRVTAEVYAIYEKRLLRIKGLDFDDLLVKPLKAFKDFPGFLQRLQERFLHVLVDEFQDTNRAQYLLVNAIAQKHRNLCVVGDDDQAIYGFRGATVENILDFERDWHDAKVIRLEQNYRSRKPILDVAWTVIKNNSERRPKKLWTKRKGGTAVDLIEVGTDEEEALKVAGFIEDERMRNKRTYNQIAILYRTNAQSLAFERVLRAAQIPYKVIGGLRFYERKEIKDLLAYLRLITNPDDDVSFLRIINYPPRSIGEVLLGAIQTKAQVDHLTLERSLKQYITDPDLSSRRRNALSGFIDLMDGFRSLAEKVPFPDLVREIVVRIGLRERLLEEEKDDPTRAESKRANLEILVRDVERYIQIEPESSIESFLEEVSLITEMGEIDESKHCVNLLTLHSAKGLEFQVVFICGLEEGLLPLEPRNPDRYVREIEEERRLFYVGATRARDRLLLTYAMNRFRWGNHTGGVPSRFLNEIPVELLNIHSSYRFGRSRAYRERRWGGSKVGSVSLPAQREYISAPTASHQAKLAHDELRNGLLVKHPKFGLGVIVDFRKRGMDSSINIDFDEVGSKTLVLKYAKLEIVS